MGFNHELLFFFSALGAFNSSILSIYFFCFTKQKQPSNYFLGALLGVLSVRIWKSLFFYFNPDLSKIYLQIGLSACFFIGPFLFFYCQSKHNSNYTDKKYWLYQLLVLIILTVGIGVVYPYERFPIFWKRYFYKIINYQWLVYIVLSGFTIRPIFKKWVSKHQKLTYNEVWVLSVFIGVSLIWLAYFTSSYTSYISGALSFSFILYLCILLILFKRKQSFNISEKKAKYSANKIAADEAALLIQQIEEVLIEKKLFKNSNLTLPKLAKEIKLRPHIISQLLNDNLNKNFTQFINEYRIEEAKYLLKHNTHLKMEVIAEDCGFNSNSTFYTAFKKVTNTTPAKYKKNSGV